MDSQVLLANPWFQSFYHYVEDIKLSVHQKLFVSDSGIL